MTRTRLYFATLTAVLVLSVGGCARIDPEAELAAATASLAAGNYAEAGIRLSNVIQAQPSSAEARRLRGELALLLGDFPVAVEELERARSFGAPPDATALGLADALATQGQAERALTILDSAQEALAGDANYWTVRAEVLLSLGRSTEAEQALDRADQLGGGARAVIARAGSAFARGDTARAERLLADALTATPNDPSILNARAQLFARTGRLAEAAVELDRAAELYRTAGLLPREVATLLGLVQMQLARNDLDAAERTAARLAERAPQAALTAYMQGLVAYRRGRFDEAAALIQPLVAGSPETVQFRSLLGAIQLALGNFGQAEQQLQMVLASSPRDPAAVKLLAETHLRQQRPEAAIATLRAVADAAAEDPQVGLLSGLANLLAGNAAQGLLYLEQAASLDPTNELLKLQLARAYLAEGRDADAASLLEGAFGGGPAALETGLLRLFAEIRVDPVKAEASAAELLEQFPRDPRALTAVAIHRQLRGDTTSARELFEQAAALETNGATARLTVAALLVQEGRSEEAEQLLVRVVEQQPENIQALTALAELMVGRGAYNEAAEVLAGAAGQSDSVAPRIALAQLHIRTGDLAAAKRELDAASAAEPGNPEVVAALGLLALAEGRSADAAALLRRAEADLPNRLGVTLALARAELANGRPDEARTALRRVLVAAPRSLPLRFVLGEAELALGNSVEALSIAGDLKAEFPTQSAGYLLEADASLAARRYSAAADSLGEAFERDRTWGVMVRWLGALELADRRDELLSTAQRWVADNPNHAPGTVRLAGVLQRAGRNEPALDAYETVLGLEADNIIALNNAAYLAHELERPAALAYAERAFALAADNPAVLDTLGWILLDQNREMEAVEHLSRAVELAPNEPEIRYHLATALAANQRPAEARAILAPLLESGVEFDRRADAARLLESL